MSKRLPYPYVKDRSGKRYWRSLRERSDSPALEAAMVREFPPGVADPPDGVSRRDFFRLMGASAALAGVAACRRPDERILPYSRQPEDLVPGVPLFFATAMPWNGTAIGLLVESHEGRPTKIEGNPKHPESLGSLNTWAQASVLDLYDPDRSDSPTENGEPRTWEQAVAALGALGRKSRATQGRGLAILTEGHRSPTTAQALAQLKAVLPQAEVVRYEAFSKQNSRAGAKLAFGRPLEVVHDIAKAHVVVAIDSDFLMDDGAGGIRHAKGYAQARTLTDPQRMNRMYSVESTLSVTGSMADHRLRLPSHEVANFALTLARECGVNAIGQNLRPLSPEAQKFFKAVAVDLDKNRQACTIVVGDKQPAAVHAAVHLANVLLGIGAGKPVALRPGLRRFVGRPRRPRRPVAEDCLGRGHRPGHPRRQPGLERPVRRQLRQHAGQAPGQRPCLRGQERDLGDVQVAREPRPLPRVVGRCPLGRRHGVDRPAAHRASL